MTDLNVKKEYLNLVYTDCGKVSAGEKVKKLLAVPGTQYLIFGVILGVFPLLGVLTSSFVFAVGNTMIYAIMAIGFCLLMGYSGLASLGTAGFVGIGAYIAYYFMQVYGAPFGIGFIVTVMISLFSGVLVGFISLRIEGIYLAILTLGLSEILRNTFISLKSSIKLDMSKVRLFGVKIGEEQVYLLILALFVLLLFITSNLKAGLELNYANFAKIMEETEFSIPMGGTISYAGGDRLGVTALALNCVSLSKNDAGVYALTPVSPILSLADVVAATK